MNKKKILVIGTNYEGKEMDFKKYELYDFSIEKIMGLVELIDALEGMEG